MNMPRTPVSLLAALALCLAHSAAGVAVRTDSAKPMRLRKDEKPVLYQHMLQNFIVVPEHKLLFCYIEKVANKNFNILFNRLRHKYNKSIYSDSADNHVWMQNTPDKLNMGKEDLEKALADRSWHKAVFYREPLERFVSAFRNKCQTGFHQDKYWCEKQFGHTPTFEDAVHFIKDMPLQDGFDPQPPYDNHFSRQLSFCGGLNQTLQFYDTVVKLDMQSSHKEVQKLLRRIGAKSNWVEGFDELFPNPSKDSRAKKRHYKKGHNTNAGEMAEDYFDGEDMELAQILVKHFDADYKLFQMSPPDYAHNRREDALVQEGLRTVHAARNP